MYTSIKTSVTGRVATITLNRPEVSNALRYESYGEVRDAVNQFSADPAIGAIVITGEGKHFSAGGDILRFKQLIESETYLGAENIVYAGEMTKAIRRSSKPVIAMVNGVSTGAGLSLCLACDYRIVDSTSRLIMGFIKLGLPGDTGSIYLLARMIGVERASKMMMTGETVQGEDAVAMGLATMCAGEGELAKATYDFANQLAGMPAKAIARQKKLLAGYFFKDLDAYYEDEATSMAEASREPDFAEAVYGFLERRQPEYNKEA